MKHFIIKNGCKVVCISAIALSSLSSCMKDDLTNCPAPKVSLKFDYTYNVENADAFSQEVKNLNVYVFDKNGKYFDTYTQSADKFETGHSMDITDLQEGKYTFVCLARDKNLQVAEPTVTTRWSSASPNSHQVFLPSTTCRRKWERKTERLLSTTRSSPLSTPPRHLSTSRARRTHPAN